MQNVKLLLATILLTFGVIVGAVFFLSRGSAQTPSGAVPIKATENDLLESARHFAGATESAQFVIVEFSDFQCPACAAYSPRVKSLVNSYPDKVRLVYRHYPLSMIHKHAIAAARAAEAASSLGKFWSMHDLLFTKQAEWSKLADPRDFFIGLAAQIGLNKDEFTAALDDQVSEEIVQADLRRAERLQLQATPTFFLNNEQMSFEEIEKKVANALGKPATVPVASPEVPVGSR